MRETKWIGGPRIYFKHIENISGVYVIRNALDGKVYVGSSIRIRKRLIAHCSMLRGNRHPNNRLQRAWNRDGERSFEFIIHEACVKESLIERESVAILALKAANGDFGYNVLEDAYSPIIKINGKRTSHALQWRVKNPEGWILAKKKIGEKSRSYWADKITPITILSPLGDETKVIKSRRVFAREHGVPVWKIHNLIAGRVGQIDGWTLANAPRISYYHRDGRVVRVHSPCIMRRHFPGVRVSALSQNPTIYTSKGWAIDRSAFNNIKDKFREWEINLVSPNGEERTFIGRKEAIAALGISSGSLCWLISGKLNSVRGWKLSSVRPTKNRNQL